ncbi:hypothetical protein J3458_001603 [Metarhizium acridum]|uniref:uncharacterized protein n=1 Tax=Metarhizium acridum TaxID=92637 RepID=UPI001C6A9FBB|nr:hypothetical protein J3458_001603 [Metarhizium acridum]
MTSWYSNILTRTTSQISSLRSTLLASENDGDTEDDTHVCRVLRNYYGDKGRPLPSWLPPDPKAPAPAPAVQQPLYVQPQVGARYGGLQSGGAGASGGLSSLWDSAPQGKAPAAREDVFARPVGSQVAAGGGAGGSAQDRLKQRLWGAGRQSPGQAGGQFQPPGASYEDRFAPGSSYGGQSGGGHGGQGRGRQGLPSGPRGYR